MPILTVTRKGHWVVVDLHTKVFVLRSVHLLGWEASVSMKRRATLILNENWMWGASMRGEVSGQEGATGVHHGRRGSVDPNHPQMQLCLKYVISIPGVHTPIFQGF